MTIEVFSDEAAVAKQAAKFIATEARAAIEARGRFLLAVSGGRTPWLMLRELANEEVPWAKLQLFQVDERVAPAGDPDRNLTHLQASFLAHVPIGPDQVHAMPVEMADLQAAAASYAATLEKIAGSPPVLDLIHLGLGPDGHTASLVPGDPVLQVTNADVAVTGPYQNHPRMTLTYPVLNRARKILWVVTGAEKAGPVVRLLNRDTSIPAGRVEQTSSVLFADKAAAEKLGSSK